MNTCTKLSLDTIGVQTFFMNKINISDGKVICLIADNTASIVFAAACAKSFLKGIDKVKVFSPMLFTDLKQYNKKQFGSDLIAGVIVAVIALPLSIALAIASGVTPEAGLYTAIVAGFITAVFGGSNVQIAGPTAAFATIVAGIVAKNGTDGLMIATVMAGIILIIMGCLKLGNLIRFIPFAITTGFTFGIAVTLLIGQLKDFFGITYQNGEAPIETLEKLRTFIVNISTINWQAVIVGGVCLAILIIWPKIYDKIPASILAVAAAVIMVTGLGMEVNTIGDLFDVSGKPPVFRFPQVTFSAVVTLLPDALTIAILAGIESLLSCVVADGMIGHSPSLQYRIDRTGNGEPRFCSVWRYSCNRCDCKNSC